MPCVDRPEQLATSWCVGLVLAAGAGRRMGGPKALVRAPGTGVTFVERAINDLYAGGLTRVVVVTGAAGREVGELVRAAGALPVPCPEWEEGMGASLRAGLVALSALAAQGRAADSEGGRSGGTADDGVSVQPVTAALVTLVDLPDVGEYVHQRLLAGASRQATNAGAIRAGLWRAAYDGVPGHPVLLGRDHWAGVMVSALGDQGARTYLAAHPVALVECGDLATGRDVDRPSDQS